MDPRFTAAHHDGDGPPLLLLHGFTDTWRTWELVLPALEREHEVLAPTLAGHAGGPPLHAAMGVDALLDGVEAAMDAAGWDTAHVAGNSLGGHLALRLAERGRARSVVALAPAGGWRPDDQAERQTMRFFLGMHDQLQAVVPHADAIAATPEGRRRATSFTTVNWEHLPADLVAHMMRGAAACDVPVFVDAWRAQGWTSEASAVECPVRIVWGTQDQLLRWPDAAALYREDLPHADWVVLEDVGHCPQLDVPTETAQLIGGFT